MSAKEPWLGRKQEKGCVSKPGQWATELSAEHGGRGYSKPRHSTPQIIRAEQRRTIVQMD